MVVTETSSVNLMLLVSWRAAFEPFAWDSCMVKWLTFYFGYNSVLQSECAKQELNQDSSHLSMSFHSTYSPPGLRGAQNAVCSRH